MRGNLFLQFLVIAFVGFFLAKVCYHFSDDFLNEKISKTVSETLHESIQINDHSVKQAFIYKNVEKIVINSERADIIIQKNPDNKSEVQIQTTNHSLQINQTNQVLTLNLHSKRSMVIYVPSSVKAIELNTKSGDIKITDMTLTDLVLNTFSGDLALEKVSADEASIKSMSGDINWKGTSNKLQAKTISGNIILDTTSHSPNYDLDTVSGEVNIITAKPLQASLDVNSVSGVVTTDPMTQGKVSTNILKVRSVSGNIQINNKK